MSARGKSDEDRKLAGTGSLRALDCLYRVSGDFILKVMESHFLNH